MQQPFPDLGKAGGAECYENGVSEITFRCRQAIRQQERAKDTAAYRILESG